MKLLEEFLSESGMTQSELAVSIGVSQPTVSDWINDKFRPSIESLKSLSKVTGISLENLINDLKEVA